MAVKLQYNKTFIQQLQKQLVIREKALPTLKSKETALRVEVKQVAYHIAALEEELEKLRGKLENAGTLWMEFPPIVRIRETLLKTRNIAGVKVPELRDVKFSLVDVSYFHQPAWIRQGIDKLQQLLEVQVKIELAKREFDILSLARKKTTQKVNLYEKVQIPEYREGIVKIKRYLEDQDNLSKAAQKIIKERTKMKEARL